jgi:hypothetical protein
MKKFLISLDSKLFKSLLTQKYQKYRYKKNFESKILYKIEINYDKKENLLDKLADLYGTDKGGKIGVFINKKSYPPHTYTDYYNQLFYDKRMSILKVFECGIGTNNTDVPSNMGKYGKPAASLFMWREFFPNANIYGADIDKSILISSERIETHFIDQTNVSSIEAFWLILGKDNFDLIIDDGLHRFEAGATLFENSITKLSETGVYIIEDVTHSDLIKYYSFFSEKKYDVRYVKFYSPEIKSGQSSNHNLIEVRNNSKAYQ